MTETEQKQSLYAILGLPDYAPPPEVDRAFKLLAKEHHSDTHPGDNDAAARLAVMSAARDVIGTKGEREGLRSAYDNKLKYGALEGFTAANPFAFATQYNAFLMRLLVEQEKIATEYVYDISNTFLEMFFGSFRPAYKTATNWAEKSNRPSSTVARLGQI